jgi:hypothetical protein
MNRLTLLLRHSRDGFNSSVLHERCEGHSNTFTVIPGKRRDSLVDLHRLCGITQMEWSRKLSWDNSCCKSDHRYRAFLFTLANQPNLEVRKFILRTDLRPCAINCSTINGVTMSRGPNLCLHKADRKESDRSYSHLGGSYETHTTVSAGSYAWEMESISMPKPSAPSWSTFSQRRPRMM